MNISLSLLTLLIGLFAVSLALMMIYVLKKQVGYDGPFMRFVRRELMVGAITLVVLIAILGISYGAMQMMGIF